jgi:hypothetical protein
MADFDLSDMVNIGQYGGIFCHNPLLRHHKTAVIAGFWLSAMDCH